MFVLGYVCNRLGTPKFEDTGALELFVDLYALCLVLSFIPWRIRRWAKGIIYAAMYSTSIVDMYCYVKFGSTFTPTMLLLIGETTGSVTHVSTSADQQTASFTFNVRSNPANGNNGAVTVTY